MARYKKLIEPSSNAVSQREFGKVIGVTQPAVAQFKDDDRLVIEYHAGHNKILVNESIDKLNATIKLNGGTFRDRSKEKTYDELTGEVCSTQLDLETKNSLELYNNARALREKAAALQADADYQKSIGKLVDRDHVDRIIFERSRQFRDILMACSRRVAPELATITDIKETEQLLEREFRAVLEQFSKLPVVEDN